MRLCPLFAIAIFLVSVAADESSQHFFTKKMVKMCLKPEFLYQSLAAGSQERCAVACRGIEGCQGFKLLEESTFPYKCELYLFDRNSRNIHNPDCTNNESVWIRNQPAEFEGFTGGRRYLCLKKEFLYHPAVGTGPESCAAACRGRSRCQGFRLLDSDFNVGCELLEFDKCSHDLNRESCYGKELQFFWTRNLPGLQPGQRCPQDYAYKYRNSVGYKLVKVSRWAEGATACDSEPGLTKYADAADASEAQHLHKKKTSMNLSFFLGGYELSGTSRYWKWLSCGNPILAEVWGPGQPNDETHHYTDIWIEHVAGVDNTGDVDPGLNHALCECVDPF